ncbi:MAG: hypothetical protein JKX79_03355 [Labilibaculum sp.]|nr:hypothetical protein [Labilibaculum sp.]
MKQKLPYILEIIWLIVMVVGLVAAIHKTINSSFSDSTILYIIAGIAALMYAWKRYMRKLQEKNQVQK